MGNLLLFYDNCVIKIVVKTNKKFKHKYTRELLFQNEVNFLKEYKSNIIIKFYFVNMEHKYIVLERANCTMRKALERGFITKEYALNFINNLEIEFLENEIVHRNLDYKNIVYFKATNELKVVDFEIASYGLDLSGLYYKHRGTNFDNFSRIREQICTLPIPL